MVACWVRDSFTFEILIRSWHLINGCPLEKAICNVRQEMTLLLQPLHETPIHQSYTIRFSTIVPIHTTASRRKVLKYQLSTYLLIKIYLLERLSHIKYMKRISTASLPSSKRKAQGTEASHSWRNKFTGNQL